MDIHLDFTAQELEVIAVMVPDLTVEVLTNRVMRSWFSSNVDRTYAIAKTQVEKLGVIMDAKQAIVDSQAVTDDDVS